MFNGTRRRGGLSNKSLKTALALVEDNMELDRKVILAISCFSTAKRSELILKDRTRLSERKPECIQGIAPLKRKEASCYKPFDLWSQKDDLLFLKWITNKRNRCYHTMSRDTSCRPHELLALKIKDIVFKNVDKYQYAQIVVNGKTGSRSIPII